MMEKKTTHNIWTDYPSLPLPKVLDFIVDNRGKTVPTAPTGHKLIATNCIRNEILYPIYEKIRYLSEETYQTWFRSHPLPGDIIFVCKGTPGRVCMVPDPIDFCIAQDMVALRVNKEIIYNRYLLVVLRSEEIQKQIYNYSVGDVIPHFKKSFFDQLLIPIPPMAVQKMIGDYYFCFSQKIEINNQINRNLEEQAKAIFKSWFVDFEPFQDGEFVDSELGLIPDGWRIATMNEVTTEQRKKVGEQRLKVFSAVNTGNLKLSEEYFNKQVFSKDIGKYIVVDPLAFAYNPARVNIGSIGMNMMGYPGCVSPVYVVFTAEKDYHHFMNIMIKRPFFQEELKSRSSGSVRQSLSYKDFCLIKIVYPPHNVIEQFNQIYEPILSVIKHYQIECTKLQETRDTLLPKLMSREINIPEVKYE